MVIGVIGLSVTDILKVEAKMALGFNAFVILILAVLTMKGNQESAVKKKLKE